MEADLLIPSDVTSQVFTELPMSKPSATSRYPGGFRVNGR